jgi:hypothetical protein
MQIIAIEQVTKLDISIPLELLSLCIEGRTYWTIKVVLDEFAAARRPGGTASFSPVIVNAPSTPPPEPITTIGPGQTGSQIAGGCNYSSL